MIGALSFLLSQHRSVADSLIIFSGDGRHFVVIILFDLNYVNMTLSKITGVKMGDNVGIYSVRLVCLPCGALNPFFHSEVCKHLIST